MAGFESVLKSLGYVTGAVTGGPSQVKAISGAVAVKGKIDSYLAQFGKSIGGIVGPDLFNKIGAGAKVSGDAETKSFVDTNILTGSTKTTINMVFLGTLLLLAYFLYRKSK